jgi:hypothetical protein
LPGIRVLALTSAAATCPHKLRERKRSKVMPHAIKARQISRAL